MPVYSMNLFKLPKEICEEINGVLAKFWWSGNGDKKKGMHWFAWNRLCIPKREGGLEFRDLENFNLALLGKQVWRILQNPDCMMAKIMKRRYFHDTNILNANQGRKASYIWKSIFQGRDLVKQVLRFIVGDGSKINAWLDLWLPLYPPRQPLKRNDGENNVMVCDWFNTMRTGWDVEKLTDLVEDEDLERIKATLSIY